ncbi:cyanoexosortase B system-associated protein [Anabaena subtropica]|uniref:Cyanoexosortase B system-associated protein n=1 Tax=Anabaena subtropica FACHB-260 TaxID=2692884 RepID=A0ABR8CVJ0_9NOST|nr:cyanoexosortase B system-associated protein [Anabaena subtropica]MBD2347212.1 cyanoexosortase B system-associated protein [Anabaena subtropica FACHB-260]
MIPLSKLLKQKHLTTLVVLLLFLLLLTVGAIPGYLSGRWQWKQPPPLANLNSLREIRNQGLKLPGWQTTDQAEQTIGQNKWSLQVVKQEGSKNLAILLLLPQNSSKNQPEVEWTDVSGWGKLRWGKWDIAQSRSAQFTVTQPANSQGNDKIQVDATFFRASTNQETFAVLQWYALPNAGYPSPVRWFLADQLAQLQKNRAPWVAVSILIPIEPLGQVETTWPLAQSIGETVQSTLMAGPLKISS